MKRLSGRALTPIVVWAIKFEIKLSSYLYPGLLQNELDSKNHLLISFRKVNKNLIPWLMAFIGIMCGTVGTSCLITIGHQLLNHYSHSASNPWLQWNVFNCIMVFILGSSVILQGMIYLGFWMNKDVLQVIKFLQQLEYHSKFFFEIFTVLKIFTFVT